jgi:hypothetical protein
MKGGVENRPPTRVGAECGLVQDSLSLSGRLDSAYEALISDIESSGQLRPYVRPIARQVPPATMGVRLRVRHQSSRRARSTCFFPVLPEPKFLTTAFPITLFSASWRISRACARRLPSGAGTSRRSGRGTSLCVVDLVARHHRPCDSRHLIRQSHGHQPDRPAF